MSMSESKVGITKLTRLLMEMNAQGGFSVAVLTDRDGFPIASAAPGQNSDRESAVVALVQRTAAQARELLGMAETDEVSLYDAEGMRLVCRPFLANGHEMILAVLVPDKHQSYRRLTSSAVSQIRQLWS